MTNAEQGASAPPADAPRAAIAREAALAGVGILLALGALKHAAAVLPWLADYAGTIAAGLQLYLPIYLVGRRGITLDSLGLSWARWRDDLRLCGGLTAVTALLYAPGFHVWQTSLLHRALVPRMPEDFLGSLVSFGVVALAEETYFRGYLQERCERLWPARRRLFGAPFGAAIFVTSAVFALAHFVGEYRPDRLGPFLPSLLFGLLRARTGTIVGAVGYHAFCNVLADVLFACYRAP